MKLKKINFTAIKVFFFFQKISKSSSDKSNYKYFIGYWYNDQKVKPLHITTPYVKSYNVQFKWMYFLIEDDYLSEKCNTVWDKVSTSIRKEFDSQPIYNF